MGRLPDYPYMTAACKHIVVIPRDREYALLLVPRDYHSGHSRGTKGRAILTNGAPFDWGVPTATMQVKTLLTKGSRRSRVPRGTHRIFSRGGHRWQKGSVVGGHHGECRARAYHRRRLHQGNQELRPGTHARTGANVAFCPGTFHGCALIF